MVRLQVQELSFCPGSGQKAARSRLLAVKGSPREITTRPASLKVNRDRQSATDPPSIDETPGAPWGPGVAYDAVGGSPLTLQASSLVASTTCLSGDLTTKSSGDPRPGPPVADGYSLSCGRRT